MPMTRYEIRNEYSLADPDLYRAADKDDPEALLEGVAMAGLVGVLRQLGDLAEFAAEIFHNLHEEVMATAARGHGLMIRVQQLETEIPSIERAFLSQIDHSSFFYQAGVDWHPNLQQDQNLVTQGDLPRFIMDSYEDCRAPPRLFLLDKFDVAGAGSCLKRYTDPSFFKVEISEMINTDVQREKKIRKAKKKGPRWRNGETPEVLPTSHTSKLHQLFLEERVETSDRNPSSRVKLKRRLNGFPFDSKTGKSYMEKLLKSPSPDHKVLHEVSVNSSPVMSATNKESGFKIFEVQPLSPDRVSGGRNRSPPSSVDDEENTVNPSMYDPNKPPINDELCGAPNSYPSISEDGISSTLDKVTAEKVVVMDAESYREGSLTGYQSDEVASEIDNYVDAPSTMESEVDGDSELRVKSDITSPQIKSGSLISDADEEHLHTRSSDSQSTGDSIIFDEGNNSFIKEMSSFSSDSPTTSAEKPQAEKNSVKGFQYDDVPVNEMVNASSYQKTADEEFQVNHQSKPVGSDDTYTETTLITNCISEVEQLTASQCSNGSIPASMHSASEEVETFMLKAPESDEMISTLNDKEKKANLVIDPPCSLSHCGFVSQSEDDSPGSSAGEQLVDEPNGRSLPCITSLPDINCHTTDSSVKETLDLLHEDDSDEKDWNMVGEIASTLNMPNDLSTNGTSDTISSKNLIPGKLDDEFPKFPENSPDYPVTAHNGDNIELAVSEEENLNDVLGDDEGSNGSTDSPNHFPCNTEASLEKKLDETSFADSQNLNVEENCSSSSTDYQINSVNLKLWNLADSPDKPMEGVDAHAGDVIPEEESTRNETLALETLTPCEGGELQVIGLTHHVVHNDSEALESSSCIPEDLEETARTEDTAEMDGLSLCLSNTGREVTEISGSADLKSVNAVHILLDTSDSEVDKSKTTAVPAVSDNASLNKLVEEHNNFFENSCVDELENDEKCPSECHGKSDIVENMGPTDASVPGFETDFCNAVNNDHPELKVSGNVPNSHLVLEVDEGLNLVHAATIESPVEPYGIDREQELFNQSDLGNPVPDALPLPVDYDTGESIARVESPLDQLDQKLLHPDEISSEFSSLLPTSHQQVLNNDDCMWDKDSSPVLSLVECQGPPLFSELPRQSNHEIDVPEYSKGPLGFTFPPSNPFSETNQINLTDLPPLPPLPPVEWRMGKLQNFSSFMEGELMRHNELSPQLISPLQNFSSITEGELMRHNDLSPQLISPLAVPSGTVSSSMPPTSTDDTGSSPPTASTSDINSSHEETNHSLIEATSETASKEENGENSCSSLQANTLHKTTDLPSKIEDTLHKTTDLPSKIEDTLHKTTDLPSKIEDERHQIIMPISESVSTSATEENGVENGSRTVKLPRPRNPLVGDVTVLDKSKLRKVTERVRPEIQKVDERDSLLEQIRTKSFNLKPALPTRPSIRGGPSTNLNVAAMLEKANAIRQAFAGSDEDDSDSWSDS